MTNKQLNLRYEKNTYVIRFLVNNFYLKRIKSYLPLCSEMRMLPENYFIIKKYKITRKLKYCNNRKSPLTTEIEILLM